MTRLTVLDEQMKGAPTQCAYTESELNQKVSKVLQPLNLQMQVSVKLDKSGGDFIQVWHLRQAYTIYETND